MITCGATAYAAAPHQSYAMADTVALGEVNVTVRPPERTRVGMDGAVTSAARVWPMHPVCWVRPMR